MYVVLHPQHKLHYFKNGGGHICGLKRQKHLFVINSNNCMSRCQWVLV